MASYKGYSYNRYRGRTNPLKILAVVLLVLVILGSVAFLLLQKYIVYDESGTPHFVIDQPADGEDLTAGPLPEEDLDITIEDAPTAVPQVLQVVQLGEDPDLWAEALSGPQNAFCVTVKASGGQLRLPFAKTIPGQVRSGTAAETGEALAELLAGERYSIARLSCLRDGSVARTNLEDMGLENTGGYIFYDGANENWLDPGKKVTREYLAALAVECAELGFDEILLTDLTYPTAGKLDKIAYGFDEDFESQSAYNTEQIAALLREIHTALGEGEVKLSLELPEAVIKNEGVDETAGINLWDTLMARLDHLYVPTAEERVDDLVSDTLGNGVLMPELTAVPTIPSYKPYLLLAP